MNEKKNLTTEETFSLAIENHKKNNLQIAEKLYKEVLKINPNHLESIFLLGTLSAQTKKFNEAKQLLNKVIEIQPHNKDAHNNLGNVLKELGEFQKAISCYQKVLQIDPDFIFAHDNLGTVFKELGELEKSIICYQKAIKIQPNYVAAHNNLGIIYKELGEYQKAINCYKKAIQINLNYADAHNNLGILYKELGKYTEAFLGYQKAIFINSNHINAIKNISILSREIRLNNITKANSASLKKLFLLLFRRNDISHSDILFNAKLLLLESENYNQLRQVCNTDSLLLEKQIIQNLLKEELFLLMLQKSLITDLFLEKMLTTLRCEILLNLTELHQDILKKNFEFIISLAEQCFLNEYVFVQSNKEASYINQLKNSLENDKVIKELEIAILGCFIPLYSSEIIVEKLLNYKSKNILFNDLINMQIKEPSKEKELLNSIKSLGKISDDISQKVRDQYEENPYPRWRYTYMKSPSNLLNNINNQIRPNKIKFNNKFNNPNILVAGCGTGKHIFVAEDYLNANILVVDLSIASLAYAKRKTEELGLNNVEFLHADILQLNNLNRKFDLIECMGVLHHMENPIKGLKVLLDLLEPHGFLKLGLYSQIARQDIVRAKEFIRSNNFKSTIDDIRSFRQVIINEKNDQLLHKICNKFDFYSTSSVRDLVFHVQEHRFTLPQLSKILLNFNLEFLGFADLIIKSKYSDLYPNDKNNVFLDNWNQFEIDNPNTFIEMYKFWVRKIQKI